MFHLNCMLKKLLFISMSVMNVANGKKQCISFRKKGYVEPRPLLKGSMASSSFVVASAYKKLAMGIPFYRQEKELSRKGLSISRQVICNWFVRCARQYLEPVFQRMEQDIRKSSILNMDETTLLCLQERKNGRESKSYEWLCMTNEYEKNQMALYYGIEYKEKS